jgi:hypothetical protein
MHTTAVTTPPSHLPVTSLLIHCSLLLLSLLLLLLCPAACHKGHTWDAAPALQLAAGCSLCSKHDRQHVCCTSRTDHALCIAAVMLAQAILRHTSLQPLLLLHTSATVAVPDICVRCCAAPAAAALWLSCPPHLCCECCLLHCPACSALLLAVTNSYTSEEVAALDYCSVCINLQYKIAMDNAQTESTHVTQTG